MVLLCKNIVQTVTTNGPYTTSDTRRVSLVTNLVISDERGKNREVFTTNNFYFNTLLILPGLNSNASFRRYLA
jgi:uncharacterized protein (UPF0218 family)